MKSKLSKKEAIEKINDFFKQKEIDKKQVKKIKRLAMKYNIKLKGFRKRICKSCFSDLKNGSVRITKHFKTIICKGCENRNKWKIT